MEEEALEVRSSGGLNDRWGKYWRISNEPCNGGSAGWKTIIIKIRIKNKVGIWRMNNNIYHEKVGGYNGGSGGWKRILNMIKWRMEVGSWRMNENIKYDKMKNGGWLLENEK